MSNAAIARRIGRQVDTIRAWRKRFATERMAALSDRPRPRGRPRLSPADRLRVIAAAAAAPPGPDSTWTHLRLAGHLRLFGLAISASQVGRILGTVDLKPHLVRGWLTRPADPDFFTRAADICAVHRNCPAGSLVFLHDRRRPPRRPGPAGVASPGRRCPAARRGIRLELADEVWTGRSTSRCPCRTLADLRPGPTYRPSGSHRASALPRPPWRQDTEIAMGRRAHYSGEGTSGTHCHARRFERGS
ncbi:helix-turn-helix domain-containing protein [Streptomyces acidicola]|uniref:helix-turn-helix domain-containing protein n=1 Tax=Streptomyces acidicola TaxID=2596892 RepID=UPI00389A7FB8